MNVKTLNSKTAILGMGKSGQAVAKFLQHIGQEVICFDDHRQEGDVYRYVNEEALEDVGEVIISPGCSLKHALVMHAKEKEIPVIGEMSFALKAISPFIKKIAVTGTNGKTTVVLLMQHILQTAGVTVKLGGNIGVPLISLVGDLQEDDILIIELSSYQLETLSGPVFDTGVILNITPDHLDRHETLDRYAEIKCHLQACLKKEGKLWAYCDVIRDWEEKLKAGYFTYGGVKDAFAWTSENKLHFQQGNSLDLSSLTQPLSTHDKENILAVWMVCKDLGIDDALFLKGLQTFQKPSHRIEWVTSIQGVDYFNDSKGTNLDATIKAVHSMQKDVILIAGGVHKGASYHQWKEPFEGRVKCIIALGEASRLIQEELASHFPVYKVDSLEEAVERAHLLAERGHAVLLSPGCASFDMFKDYVHRGNTFKRLVFELKNRTE
ncbi:MAG: UDP-N-acetylmuramoyl-L-alanine--D-glutamate ligase [Candidatus Rhabdochlamydia sp.]